MSVRFLKLLLNLFFYCIHREATFLYRYIHKKIQVPDLHISFLQLFYYLLLQMIFVNSYTFFKQTNVAFVFILLKLGKTTVFSLNCTIFSCFNTDYSERILHSFFIVCLENLANVKFAWKFSSSCFRTYSFPFHYPNLIETSKMLQ